MTEERAKKGFSIQGAPMHRVQCTYRKHPCTGCSAEDAYSSVYAGWGMMGRKANAGGKCDHPRGPALAKHMNPVQTSMWHMIGAQETHHVCLHGLGDSF